MSFFSSFTSAIIKTVLTPVAIVKDVVNIATGEEPDSAKSLLQSAGEDLEDAIDDVCGG